MSERKLDYQIFELGAFVLQCGITLPDAKLAFQTYGRLNEAKDNAILNPTWYGGQHYDSEWLIGEGKGLDPSEYFVIVPNMFGNGLSSSPSNTPEPYNQAAFPKITFLDNIKAQRRLLEKFGVTKLKLVTGWSMGAGQTYAWASYYPEVVERAMPFMGSAKTSEHNFVFLEGVKAALIADDAFKNGFYKEKPHKGLRAMARVYAGWGLSQTWYREKHYKYYNFATLEDYLSGSWEARFLQKDPNDLLCMLDTWQTGDISNNDKYNGDIEAALRGINCPIILMPCVHDLYFPPEDVEYEAEFIPNREYRPSHSVWGHQAGGPVCIPEDSDFIKNAINDLLAMSPNETFPTSSKL